MKREKNPNLGLWSPVGGKHEAALRESLYESAAREVREEVLIDCRANELTLRGIATERGEGCDYMLFIFEMPLPAGDVPPRGPEGEFQWFPPEHILDAEIPETDKKIFWPYVLAGRSYFAVTIEWDGTRVTSHAVEELGHEGELVGAAAAP